MQDENWALLKNTVPEPETVPTWKGLNSLINERPGYMTLREMLPPLYTSPTDWSTLYGALKICQGITTQVTPGRKTIISLDMQLYIKAVQLQSKGDVNDGMVFRLGELHAVFVTCRVVGKQISESGFDHMFNVHPVWDLWSHNHGSNHRWQTYAALPYSLHDPVPCSP